MLLPLTMPKAAKKPVERTPTESGSGSGPIHYQRFPLLDSPAA
jgi:hypothetical protein